MSKIVKNPAYGFTVLLVVSTRKIMPNTQKSWNTLTFDPMEKRTAMNLVQKCFWKTWKTREWRKQLIQRTFSPTMSHGHPKVTVVLSQIQSYFVRVCCMPFTQCSWIAFFKRITLLILQDSCYSLLHSLFFLFLFVCFPFVFLLFCFVVFLFFSFIGLRLKISLQLLLSPLLIGWEISLHILSQSEVKTKPIMTGSLAFSRPERWPHVFYSRYDWLFRLPSSFWLVKVVCIFSIVF